MPVPEDDRRQQECDRAEKDDHRGLCGPWKRELITERLYGGEYHADHADSHRLYPGEPFLPLVQGVLHVLEFPGPLLLAPPDHPFDDRADDAGAFPRRFGIAAVVVELLVEPGGQLTVVGEQAARGRDGPRQPFRHVRARDLDRTADFPQPGRSEGQPGVVELETGQPL